MEFSWDILKLNSVIYTNPKIVTVYRGTADIVPYEVAIKQVFVSTAQEANRLMSEAYSMEIVSHPNIVKLAGVFVSQNDNILDSVVFITRFFPKGDLEKEILTRRNSKHPWQPEELQKNIYDLISAHAYLESLSICHRDIKPQNIFIDDSGALLVADLGCAIKNEKQIDTRTIAGTPVYLSPKVRAAYYKHLMGNGSGVVDHDIFKSDVFSLGLTFLYMASLTDVSDLSILRGLDEKIDKRCEELEDPRIASIIRKMLTTEEEARPYFSEVLRDFENVFGNRTGEEAIPELQNSFQGNSPLNLSSYNHPGNSPGMAVDARPIELQNSFQGNAPLNLSSYNHPGNSPGMAIDANAKIPPSNLPDFNSSSAVKSDNMLPQFASNFSSSLILSQCKGANPDPFANTQYNYHFNTLDQNPQNELPFQGTSTNPALVPQNYQFAQHPSVPNYHQTPHNSGNYASSQTHQLVQSSQMNPQETRAIATSQAFDPISNFQVLNPAINSPQFGSMMNSPQFGSMMNSEAPNPGMNPEASSPILNSQAFNPPMNSQPTRSAMISQPIKPAMISQPINPPMISQPINPPMISQPINPKANSQPIKPAMISQPINPTANSHLSSPPIISQFPVQLNLPNSNEHPISIPQCSQQPHQNLPAHSAVYTQQSPLLEMNTPILQKRQSAHSGLPSNKISHQRSNSALHQRPEHVHALNAFHSNINSSLEYLKHEPTIRYYLDNDFIRRNTVIRVKASDYSYSFQLAKRLERIQNNCNYEQFSEDLKLFKILNFKLKASLQKPLIQRPKREISLKSAVPGWCKRCSVYILIIEEFCMCTECNKHFCALCMGNIHPGKHCRTDQAKGGVFFCEHHGIAFRQGNKNIAKCERQKHKFCFVCNEYRKDHDDCISLLKFLK